MGVGIGAAHDRALVLKDLDPGVLGAQDLELPDPFRDDGQELRGSHQRNRHVGLGVEAHDSAGSCRRLTVVQGGLWILGVGFGRRGDIWKEKVID